MNKVAILAVIALTIGVSGCSQTPKDNVKACEIQYEIFTQGLAETAQVSDLLGTFIAKSQEAEAIAEPELALHLGYQTDFFKILADPTTQQDWTPSQEMNTAKTRIGEICRSLGFKFE